MGRSGEELVEDALAIMTVILPAAFAVALIVLVCCGIAPAFVLAFAAVALLAAGLGASELAGVTRRSRL